MPRLCDSFRPCSMDICGPKRCLSSQANQLNWQLAHGLMCKGSRRTWLSLTRQRERSKSRKHQGVQNKRTTEGGTRIRCVGAKFLGISKRQSSRLRGHPAGMSSCEADWACMQQRQVAVLERGSAADKVASAGCCLLLPAAAAP